NPLRRVALKMLRPGMVSGPLAARLQRESQVLGRLQHPGIAHVYESGNVSVNGRIQPFFAMELIVGERINIHANNRGLGVLQRVELLSRVCDAVQHAHQKGVIHRDLKPANILVVESATVGTGSGSLGVVDEIGQPKVLDFGIARVVESDVNVTTLQTSAGQVIGTLAYMSPEQLAGDVEQLDTRSDIYALGVVLWQLLTNRLPFDLNGMSMAEAARVIRDDAPPRLGSLHPDLRGDLETIVMKAIEKEPQHRYQTAAELSADLRRFVKNEPILAKPPSAFYHLKKFGQRNRALVASTMFGMVTVVAGLVTTAALLISVTRERDSKQDALESAEAVTAFFTGMLSEARPEASGKDVTVLEVMEDASQTIGDKFLDQPLLEARVRHTMGETFLSMSKFEQAQAQFDSAMALWTSVPDAPPVDRMKTSLGLATIQFYQDKHAEAIDAVGLILQEAVGLPRDTFPFGDCYTIRGAARMRLGKLDEAESDFEQAIAALEKRYGPGAEELFDPQSFMAELLSRRSPDDAEAYYQDLIKRSTAMRGADHPETLLLQSNLGTHYRANRRISEAVETLQGVYVDQKRVLGPAHRQTLLTLNNLTRSMARVDQQDQALVMLDEGLAVSNEANGPESATTVFLTYARGRVLLRTSRHEKAEAALLETAALYRKVQGAAAVGTYFAEIDLLNFYQARGQFDKAIDRGEELLAIWHHEADDNPRLGDICYYLGRVYMKLDRFEEAEALFVRALPAGRNKPELGAATRRILIRLYEKWGRADEAEKWRVEGASP
ncbi:MAG: tetratricopeptide repeat protein, partial [Phycisphaerae bacterium]